MHFPLKAGNLAHGQNNTIQRFLVQGPPEIAPRMAAIFDFKMATIVDVLLNISVTSSDIETVEIPIPTLSRLPLDAMRGSLFDLTTGRISRYIL